MPETDEKPPITIALSEQFVLELADAVEKYGEATVLWAWRRILVPFLPVAGMIASENSLAAAVKTQDITRAQAQDGIALAGCLSRSSDPHQAWLAAEILHRLAKDLDMVAAAASGSKPAGETH